MKYQQVIGLCLIGIWGSIFYLTNAKAEETVFDYKRNTFYGMGHHMAIKNNVPISEGDEFVAFTYNNIPMKTKVIEVIDARPIIKKFKKRGFEKIYNNEKLWNKIGFYWGFRGPNEPPTFAKLALPEDFDLTHAVRHLPENVIVLPGKGERLSEKELKIGYKKVKKWLPVKIPDSQLVLSGVWYKNDTGKQIGEINVGKAEYDQVDKDKMIKVHVYKFFLNKGTIVGMSDFARATDKPEHADTAPPELTEDTWASRDLTSGFVSLDKEKTWQRLSIDTGFEGISYLITTIGKDNHQDYFQYHYTPH
ncbi:hypothetical protein BVX98_05800 [bacterium F11]|nr:hypothetical protein BVX98_05800 [bacterium F11]